MQNLSHKVILAVCALALTAMCQTGISLQPLNSGYHWDHELNGHVAWHSNDYTDETVHSINHRGTTLLTTGPDSNLTTIEFIAVINDAVNAQHIIDFCDHVDLPGSIVQQDIADYNTNPDFAYGYVPEKIRYHRYNHLQYKVFISTGVNTVLIIDVTK